MQSSNQVSGCKVFKLSEASMWFPTLGATSPLKFSIRPWLLAGHPSCWQRPSSCQEPVVVSAAAVGSMLIWLLRAAGSPFLTWVRVPMRLYLNSRCFTGRHTTNPKLLGDMGGSTLHQRECGMCIGITPTQCR